MRVIVDWQKCESHGMCELRAPRLFSVSEAGDMTYAFDGRDIPPDLQQDAIAAAAACPVAALRIGREDPNAAT